MHISDNITIIDDGDCQGTQLFICHEDRYQPHIDNYYITHNHYGSCSACDTLMGIVQFHENECPSEGKVSELMKLSLNMIQRMKCLGDK